MKICDKTYSEIYQDIKSLVIALELNLTLTDGGKSGLKDMWSLLSMVSRQRAFSDEHPAFKNGIWTRTLPYDGRAYCWYYDNNGNDPCHDDHVATALKAVKAQIINDTQGHGFTNDVIDAPMVVVGNLGMTVMR